MRLHVEIDADAAARRAAQWLQAEIARAAAARGRCLLALSGGRTPGRMLHELRHLRVHWHALHVFQVDERVVPAEDERRNLHRVTETLLAPGAPRAPAGLEAAQLHAMPVERADLESGARDYAALLEDLAGRPPVLDVVQLGLGADGHTASLLPRDPLAEDRTRTVGISREYQGVRRMTLTLPVLDAARHRLWLVTGADKADALHALWAGDDSLPAGRVAREAATIVADEAAAARIAHAARH